jgi:uncharacterized protein (UPF0332 family)
LRSGSDKQALAKYRLQQAEESLGEARFLLAGNKSPRSVINRAYYSMFYAILALLIYEPYSSSKHSGVLAYFNRRFVREGAFDKDLARWANKAFGLRQRGDYREYFDLSLSEVAPYIQRAEEFLRAAREHLRGKKGIE